MSDLPLSIFSLREPGVIADPYPFYERLRSQAPILRDPMGISLVSRYNDVLALLSMSEVTADRLDKVLAFRPDAEHPEIVELFASIKRQMLFLDPPRHTRLRALTSKAFTKGRIERMRTTVEQLVHRLLDAAAPSGSVDILADLAVPLPMTLIAEMLDIPVEDRGKLKRWSEDYAVFLGGTMMIDHPTMLGIARSMSAFMGYFRDLSQKREQNPGDDLLSALVLAQDEGETLDREDLCATAVLLMTAGHETTTNLIGNGVLAWISHPEELLELRRHPELMAAAVEELLRFDSPVQLSARGIAESFELSGESFRQGEVVYLALGSANRDPARFQGPDRLDWSRADNRHLSFGQGAHYCVGASLARLEAQVAFSALLERFPQLSLAGERPMYRPNPALRGLQSLRIRTCS